MLVVVSGSGKTLLGGLSGIVVAIIGSGAGSTVVGKLAGKVVDVGRSEGATVVVVVLGTGTRSTGVENRQ